MLFFQLSISHKPQFIHQLIGAIEKQPRLNCMHAYSLTAVYYFFCVTSGLLGLLGHLFVGCNATKTETTERC